MLAPVNLAHHEEERALGGTAAADALRMRASSAWNGIESRTAYQAPAGAAYRAVASAPLRPQHGAEP